MATWAIGDVHGCFRSLRALLGRPGIGGGDELWFVGDLVNRGPGSLEVLRFVAELGERCRVVLGNHDLHLLARAAGVAGRRKHDTLESILEAPDADRLLDWLRSRPLLHRRGGELLVHAGLLPDWDAAEGERRARRVEAALRPPTGDALLGAYRPRDGRGETGFDRQSLEDLRVLTLMRTVDREGRPRYDFAGPLAELPGDRYPWFAAPGGEPRGARVVCGHWAALGRHDSDGIVALDTGCAWGGALTAYRLEDGRVEQTECLDR